MRYSEDGEETSTLCSLRTSFGIFIYKNTHIKSQKQEQSKSKSITVIPKGMPEMLQLMPFNHLSVIHFSFPQPSYEEMKPWFFISNLTGQMECCTNPWDLREFRLEILAVLLLCTVLIFFISTATSQINPLVCMNIIKTYKHMDWFKKNNFSQQYHLLYYKLVWLKRGLLDYDHQSSSKKHKPHLDPKPQIAWNMWKCPHSWCEHKILSMC